MTCAANVIVIPGGHPVRMAAGSSLFSVVNLPIFILKWCLPQFVFHYGFQEELPLHINHHRDGLSYVESPAPPCEIVLIHGLADDAVPIERSQTYASNYPERVVLHEVEDDHSLRNSMGFVWEQVRSLAA